MPAAQLALPALSADGGVVVKIASTAGLEHELYEWPEYAVAKAGITGSPPRWPILPAVKPTGHLCRPGPDAHLAGSGRVGGDDHRGARGRGPAGRPAIQPLLTPLVRPLMSCRSARA
jgi:hypothetical protein